MARQAALGRAAPCGWGGGWRWAGGAPLPLGGYQRHEPFLGAFSPTKIRFDLKTRWFLTAAVAAVLAGRELGGLDVAAGGRGGGAGAGAPRLRLCVVGRGVSPGCTDDTVRGDRRLLTPLGGGGRRDGKKDCSGKTFNI